MKSVFGWLLLSAGCLGALTLSCSGSSDDAPASAGAANGGSTNATGGASAGAASGAGMSASAGSAGQGVDCAAVCAHVKALCVDNSAISDVWLSAAKSACDARVQLTPDVARLEQSCVKAAADCNASIVCVASPH